ncbi:MAG: ectoine utilization protein EutC [Rhizobiaceae bacterium]
MPDIKILTESDLRHLVKLDLEVIGSIENAFATLAKGNVVMPPILSMAIADYNGEVDVKTAYVPGIDSFAIKMSPGFFDNPKIGLPSTMGLMILFSARTGVLEALLLDNGYLTDVRTAAAGAVAAKHLSREDSEQVCIVGTGMQAQLQLKALTLVRNIKVATIWGRDNAKAETLAESLSTELNIKISATSNLEHAAREADIIVTATPSSTPLIKADWLQTGQHITAMGSDQDHKNEIEAECIDRADLYVADRLSQTSKLGELRSAIEAGVVDVNVSLPELGEIIAGKATRRSSPNDITIADLTGTGLQDTAIATLARQRAQLQSVGTLFQN